jgi:hypothetical protein
MVQVLYLDPEDDLPAIRHLLEGAQARRVLLVLPRGYVGLRDRLPLRVLRRYALDLALEVALVTRDSRTRQVARAEGVALVSSVRAGQRGRWRTPAPQRSPAERAAADRVQSLRWKGTDIGYGDWLIIWAGRALGFLVFALLLAVIVGLAALLVPDARIALVPYRQPVVASLTVRADPGVEKASLADRVVPARLLEAQLTDSSTTPTVSKRDAADAPATGLVTLINQTVGALEILPGNVVRTAAGTTVRFRTVTTATLAAGVGARVDVPIEALQPGPVGNVAAATITAIETPALRGRVSVINEQPTSGGGVKQVGVVTRADMDRLKAQLLEKLEQRALVELRGLLTEHEFLPPESLTVEILSEDYDQFLDAEADLLALQLRVLARATAVDRASIRLLAFEALKEQIPASYKLESGDVTFDVREEVRMEGRASLVEATATAQLVAAVDEGAVRSTAAGLTAEEARQRLAEAFALEAEPEVEIQPDWIKRWEWLDRVPRVPFRIHVVVSP